MIPVEFEYSRADSIADAVSMLGDGSDSVVLAGGHSLVPMLKLRVASPSRLVDISGIAELRGIREAGDHVAVGAMTTHREVADSTMIQAGCPVLAETAAGVGDLQVRNRGTIGGSIAQADSHGDLPTVLLALGGSVAVQGPSGSRTIEASDLFTGYLTTSLQPGELITEVRVPKVGTAAYVKFNRRHADWAIVGVAAVISGSNLRVAMNGMGLTPMRATAAEEAWNGSNAADAAAHAADGLRPISDEAGSAEYRSHLASVLTRRAIEAAAAR
jgi:carbon-monoxide dehydrogenase medium subunit